MPETDQQIAEAISALREAAPHVTAAMIGYYKTTAAIWLAFGAIAAAIGLFLLAVGFSAAAKDSSEDAANVILSGLVVFLLATTIAAFNVPGFLYPEAVALRAVLR